MVKEINKILKSAIIKYQQDNNLENFQVPEFVIENTQNNKFGDFSTNLAMRLSPVLKMNPINIANNLINYLKDPLFIRIDVAPPGFINFFININYLSKEVGNIVELKNKYGQSDIGAHKKIQVEFISGNPTGPLHMGNGRGGFTGDCLANILNFTGYNVKKEYYINDRGKQIDNLGESVIRRYLQEEGVKVDYPEDLYHGEYIKDLAKKIKLKDFKLTSIAEIQKVKSEIKEWALAEMLEQIKKIVVEKCGIKFHRWFSEKELYEGAYKEKVWDFLLEKKLIYKKDDAWWFKSSLYNDDKDRVIVKKDGEPTYFFSDILYLQNRLDNRKFEKIIMLWGCDHHGDVSRVQAAATALGFAGQVDIILFQLVRLMFNGKELRMSKRKGNFITLEELVDEIGLDVARWFFLMSQVDTHMDFDLNLAKKKSDQNPVFYVQYAHARICSIMKKIPSSKNQAPKTLEFSNPAELELIKELIKFPDLIEEIAQTYATHKLPQYVLTVARKFHKFYQDCRVVNEDQVNVSRVYLVKACKIVIANSLKLMGISTPEKM